MAAKKACLRKDNVKNTGKECDIAMGPTAMLIPIDPSVTFDETDLVDPYEWLNLLIHQKKAFPLFGQKAPIRSIANSNEADLLVTLEDGSTEFVRYGMYNRTFQTTSGGLCYAKSLASLLNSGMYMLEVDKNGQLCCRVNNDKSNSGLIVNQMYSPSPILGDLKDVYRNQFKYTLDPTELVQNGFIYDGCESLLSLTGLIDAEITQALAATTTKLKIGVRTECAEADLIALFGSPLAVAGNFVVTNKLTGATVSISAAAIVAGNIELTGTFVSTTTYIVKGASPAVWYAADITGYDASELGVEITIP